MKMVRTIKISPNTNECENDSKTITLSINYKLDKENLKENGTVNIYKI